MSGKNRHLIFMLCFVSFYLCIARTMAQPDWLLDGSSFEANIEENEKFLTLANGLISRTFTLGPNFATIGFQNEMIGSSIIRGLKPEAILEIDGQSYDVGGLIGQEEMGYFQKEWLQQLTSNPEAFQYESHQIGDIQARLEWKSKRWVPEANWPPKGKMLSVNFTHSSKQLAVTIHYEIYDEIPLISKWFSLKNLGEDPVRLNKFISEQLAVVEGESVVDVEENYRWEYPNIHVESDYSFHGMSAKSADHTTYWVPDPAYSSQVNYLRLTPNLLESRPPIGPDQIIKAGESFESFRTYELIYDSYDKERKMLALRRMYRILAPWALENPIFMHLTSTDPVVVKRAIDQCVETGYEMVILSFGSGLNMEDLGKENIQKFKSLADYAHERGIELGGYSLLSSRSIADSIDVIDPKTGKPGSPIHNIAPCLGSNWGLDYLEKVKQFFEKTGFDLLEHDGSYPGHLCASTAHNAHQGLEDSQWVQWKNITDFYKWLQSKGIYMNIPDWYFLTGSNKVAIGYREVNWSLPRERQVILGRQNIYDGTWYKTPSMGWTFVPLVEYHGGGAAATIEPLSEHLDTYEAHMAQNYGMGVQACYRGPRLYDTEETKALVKAQVAHYKKYRAILNSDIIHIRRADGQNLDLMLHVNPALKEKGFLMVFNPTDEVKQETLKLPLYYTGLKEKTIISLEDKTAANYYLDRNYEVTLKIEVPANGYTWLVIR